MAMLLTKPFINTINAFDATKGATIEFNMLGGAIITTYTYSVYNASGSVVFSRTIGVFDDVESVDIRTFPMSIPSSILANNQTYKIQVVVGNPSLTPNITSIASNFAIFLCYATPTFTVEYVSSSFTYVPLIHNTTINSDKIFAQLVFNANDINSSAMLNTATIRLYGVDGNGTKTLVFEGEPLYNEPFQQTITGMISNTVENCPYTSYSLAVEGVTVDGFIFNQINVGTTQSPVLVDEITGIISNYTLISSSPNLRVSNLCQQGIIEIDSTFTDYNGEYSEIFPSYLTPNGIDLLSPDAWVKWQNYFVMQQPYTLRFWMEKARKNSVIAQMLTNNVGEYAQVTYVDDGTNVYLTLESFSVNEQGEQLFPYYIESNKIPSSSVAEPLFIGIQQSNNLYELYIQVLNT